MLVAIFLVVIAISLVLGWMVKEFQTLHAKIKVIDYLDNEVEAARNTDKTLSQRLIDLEMKVTSIHSKYKDGSGITTRLSDVETRLEGLNNKIAMISLKK